MSAFQAALFGVITTFAASSGFWTYLLARKDKTSSSSKLLLGLAHDRIIHLGLRYIDEGGISREAYEDLHKFLYAPYKKMGGNGTVDRIMEEVEKLPILTNRYVSGEK